MNRFAELLDRLTYEPVAEDQNVSHITPEEALELVSAAA